MSETCTVPLRMFKLGMLVLAMTAIALPLIVLALPAGLNGHPLKALLMVFSGGVCAALAGTFVRLGLRARASGYLLQLDVSGLSHCMLSPIAWQHVRALELDEVVVKSQKSWNLKVGLDADFMNSITPPLWQRLLDIARPRIDMKQQVLIIPLAFANLPAERLLDAARGFWATDSAPQAPDRMGQ